MIFELQKKPRKTKYIMFARYCEDCKIGYKKEKIVVREGRFRCPRCDSALYRPEFTNLEPIKK